MSTSKPNAARNAARAAEANGTRRWTKNKRSRSGSSQPQPAAARTTKKAAITKLLRRKQGATLAALQDATGWKPHSLRAALTGLRKTGVEIQRTTNARGETVYRADGS
jgi:hypothetical protein